MILSKKVVNWSIFYTTLLYFVIGLKSFFLFGTKTQVMMIDNFPESAGLEILKFIFLSTTICNIPYQLFPCKESLDSIFKLSVSMHYKKSCNEPSFIGFVKFILSSARLKLLSLLLLFTAYLASISSINLEYTLSVVGTLNIFIVCILPGLFYLFLGNQIFLKIAAGVLAAFGFILFVY